ncbi:MAG: serine/threonine-protein kinase [Planctomycetota bacterium]
MTAELDWRRVRPVFEEISALEDPARRARLARLRADDPELGAMVEKLLAAEGQDDDFLRSPLPADLAPTLAGRRLGGFRIVRALASGGMGTVWEAEQDEPRRKVAVKTMHIGLASVQFRRRFRFEAELLGALQHPSIAQVYGAGVLEAEDAAMSLPWFALEYVEGARPLVAYARDEALDLDRRLRLFVSVCSAVQHAHQRGVIHRDLKAANVLVDCQGQVKVIDFGIARLIDAEGGETTQHTRTGEIVGTLESMSPEQVDGRRDEVDARTDVYALGATLYELTTGRRPYDLDGVALAEAARTIREINPLPPSRVDPTLPREVDWIVGKAMEKDPRRRYASASEIEHEITRLLAREPVLAGPPSRTYRLRKFCQRHKAGVAAAVTAALAVALGLAGAAFGLIRHQQAAVTEAAARAEENLNRRFENYVEGLFDRFTPETADGHELNRDELLVHGAQWIRSDLQDRPLLQARLLRTVGNVYASTGRYDAALPVLEDAVRIARGQGEAGEHDLAECLLRLGLVCRRRSDLARAETALREALALQEKRYGSDSLVLGPILNELGVLLAGSRPQDALACYQRTYDLLVSHGGISGDAAIVLANMGNIDLRAHRYAAARDRFERALPILISAHGEGDPRTATMIGSLAVVHRNLGNHERARELQLQDLEIASRALGPEHPDVGVGLINLAQIDEVLGDPARALTHAERGEAILRQRLGATHPNSLVASNTRARLLVWTRQLAAARRLLEECSALAVDTDDGRQAQLTGRLLLADLTRIEGDPARALQLADAVLADPREHSPKLVAEGHWQRAYALARQGHRAAALAERDLARAATRTPHAHAEARLAVLSDDPSRAVAILAEAVAAGFRDAAVLSDPEFDGLRQQPEFVALETALRRRSSPAEELEPPNRPR